MVARVDWTTNTAKAWVKSAGWARLIEEAITENTPGVFQGSLRDPRRVEKLLVPLQMESRAGPLELSLTSARDVLQFLLRTLGQIHLRFLREALVGSCSDDLLWDCGRQTEPSR